MTRDPETVEQLIDRINMNMRSWHERAAAGYMRGLVQYRVTPLLEVPPGVARRAIYMPSQVSASDVQEHVHEILQLTLS